MVRFLALSVYDNYRKSSIKPPGGLFILNPFEGGLNRDGDLFEWGGGGGLI